jgi:hypothetical protein
MPTSVKGCAFAAYVVLFGLLAIGLLAQRGITVGSMVGVVGTVVGISGYGVMIKGRMGWGTTVLVIGNVLALVGFISIS